MKSIVIAVLLAALAGCTQYPTETTQVVDDRPRLTFEPIRLAGKPAEYNIIIDGVDYGALSNYLAGKTALPIVSGRHFIEVRRAGQTIHSEQVVLGENSTRVIKVVGND